MMEKGHILNNFLKKSVFNIFDNNLMSLLHVLTGKCLNFSKMYHFLLLSNVFTSKYRRKVVSSQVGQAVCTVIR